MDQEKKVENSRRAGGEPIYKRKGVAFLINRASQSFRNRLFISVLTSKGHSIRLLLREWTEENSGSVTRSSEQNIDVFTVKCKTEKGRPGEFSKLLNEALIRIENDFKKDKQSAVLGTICINHISHLWFFRFYKRKRLKFIYDATEQSLPQWNFKVKLLSDLALSFTSMVELKLLKKIRVDAVTISGSRADELPRFSNICKNSQVLLTLPSMSQSPTAEETAAAEKELKGKTIAAAIGGFSNPASLEQALDVAASVVSCYENVIFLFIGKTYASRDTLKSMISAKDLEGRVFFLNGLPFKKMMAYLENSYVGLALHDTDDIWSEGTADNSMRHYVYMQAGLPIVGPEICEGAEAARKAECCLFVNTTSPVDVSGAVAYLLTHPDEARQRGERGRDAFREKYNWECERQKLVALLDAASVR